MIRNQLTRVALVVLVVGALLAAPAVGIGAVVAEEEEESPEDKAPMYEDEEVEPDTDGWLEDMDEPSVSAIVTLMSRLGTFVVGGGAGAAMSQSAPALMTGLLVLGTALGMVVGTGVGSVGGSVLAVTGVFATVAVGLAPAWGTAIAVFGVGLVAAAVFRRLL